MAECNKCHAPTYLEEEKTLRGPIFAAACRSCGWRGPILIDTRTKLDIPEDLLTLAPAEPKIVSYKLCDCIGPCGRKGVRLAAKGLCTYCYPKMRLLK